MTDNMKLDFDYWQATKVHDISVWRWELAKQVVALADEPRKLAHFLEGCEDLAPTARWARRCYSDPMNSRMWRRTMVMSALNDLFEGFGVEALQDHVDDMSPRYEYVNAGDVYAPTLILDREKDVVFICDVGTIVEEAEGAV